MEPSLSAMSGLEGDSSARRKEIQSTQTGSSMHNIIIRINITIMPHPPLRRLGSSC